MWISFNLNELEKLKECSEHEISVALNIENSLSELLKKAELIQSEDVFKIKRQLDFIREELITLYERKNLLIEMYKIFAESKNNNNDRLEEVIRDLKNLENT